MLFIDTAAKWIKLLSIQIEDTQNDIPYLPEEIQTNYDWLQSTTFHDIMSTF